MAVTTFTLTFGPYVDAAQTPAYVGMVGLLAPTTPVRNTETGSVVVMEPVEFTIGEDGTAQVPGLPHCDQVGFDPLGFPYRVTWPGARGTTPGSKTFVVTAADGATVDFDQLAPSSVAGIQVPVVPLQQAIAAAASADEAVGAADAAAASAASAAVSARDALITASIVGDDLVLANIDGEETVAGDVRGPQGIQGDPGDLTPVGYWLTGVGGLSFTEAAPWTHNVTLAGNVTVSGLGPTPGSSKAATRTVIFKQAASGGPYTVTWPALEWAGDAPPPVMPTAPNAELIVHLFWTGVAWRAFNGGVFFP